MRHIRDMTKTILIAFLAYGCSGGDEFIPGPSHDPPVGAGSMSINETSQQLATGGTTAIQSSTIPQSTGGASAAEQLTTGGAGTGGKQSTGGTSSTCQTGAIGCPCFAGVDLCLDSAAATAVCVSGICLGSKGHACVLDSSCAPYLACRAGVCSDPPQPSGTGGSTSVVAASTGGNPNSGKKDAGGACTTNSDCVSWLVCLPAGSCG